MTKDANGKNYGGATSPSQDDMLAWKTRRDIERGNEYVAEQVTKAEGRLTKAERDTIKRGEERARNGETNRPLTQAEYAAFLSNRAEIAADLESMELWKLRGFVSGNPHDRLEHPDNDKAADIGVDYAMACEHDISGIHRVHGEAPCKPVRPEVEDVWLQPSYAPDRKPEYLAPVDARRGMYFPRGTDAQWGAEQDAIESLMSSAPFETQDGGGLTGVEDDYWLARSLLSAPLEDEGWE